MSVVRVVPHVGVENGCLVRVILHVVEIGVSEVPLEGRFASRTTSSNRVHTQVLGMPKFAVCNLTATACHRHGPHALDRSVGNCAIHGCPACAAEPDRGYLRPFFATALVSVVDPSRTPVAKINAASALNPCPAVMSLDDREAPG